MRRLDPPLTPAWLRALALAVTALALALFAYAPILDSYPHAQNGDGAVFHKMLEAARVSVVRYHELPLWNPYECGGLPLWDNPQGIAAAPLAWLMVFTGTTRAVHLWLVLHAAMGFCGMWLFARDDLRLSRGATFLASAAWAFSGFHQQHYSGGHLAFVAFLYFPFAFYLWRRAERDLRFAVGLGLLVGWMFFEGAVYPLPHLMVFLGAETALRAWRPSRMKRIVIAGLVVGVVAFAASAARLLPVLDQLRAHRRALGAEVDALQWETLKAMFLARHHEWRVAGQGYVWPEYGTYLGPVVLALALAGVVLGGVRSAWMLALLALAFVLMLGHKAPWAPWTVLKAHVFPFTEMRVPSRFRLEVSMFLAAFAGVAYDRIVALVSRLASRRVASAARTVVLAVAFIGVGDMMSVGLSLFEGQFTSAPEAHPRASTRLHMGGPNLAPLIDQPQQNRGRLQCWEEWGFGAGAPQWEGDVPQARAADDGAVVEVADRTPNTFTIDVVVSRPGARVLVNSTYDRGWRTNVGTVRDDNKLLVVELPAGRHRVHLRYWPWGLTVGLVFTLGTALAVAAWAALGLRRRLAEAED